MSKWTNLLEESPLNPRISNPKSKLMKELNETLEKDVGELDFCDFTQNEVDFITSTLKEKKIS